MNQDTINNSIAQQMELLASLGMELAPKLHELAQACTDALLNGGKIILICDEESRHCEPLLSHLLGQGEIIERPPLPVISLHNCANTPTKQTLTMLSHVYQSNDLILSIARDAKTLALGSTSKQYNCYGVHSDGQGTSDIPELILNTSDRAQWHVAIALLSNLLVQDIEQQLFGLNTHD